MILGETVTLLRQGATGTPDVDGNLVYQYNPVTIPGCVFASSGSVELVQGRDIVTSQPKVYMPHGTVVTPYDRVTARGVTYEVDGSPNDDVSPFTYWAPGVEVRLKGVTG